MKIIYVCISLRPTRIEISKQPTLHVGLTGNVRVLVKDDTGENVTYEDHNLSWEDRPVFKCHGLTPTQNDYITRQITPLLMKAAENIKKQISKLHCDMKENIK